MNFKFLVLGAHGDIGLSIGKIIKKNFKRSEVYGCDILDHGIGNFIFKKVYKIQKPGEKGYLKKIIELSKKFDLLIPTNETEIAYLSSNKKINKEKLLINEPEIIENLNSKLKINNVLKKFNNKLSFKKSEMLKNFLKSKKKLFIQFF